MTHDNWRDLAIDLKLTNSELAERFNKLKAEYYEVKRANYDLRMQLVFAKEALRKEIRVLPPTVVRAGCNDPDPQYHEPGEYECGECGLHLEQEWTFCPSCGVWIDWDYPIYPDDDGSAYDAWRDAQLKLAMAARKSAGDA